MEHDIQTRIQAKVFEFALLEMVHQQRNTFQPLWTVESWAKFLIWMALNCGLAGDRESLELFADALGPGLTTRMRRLFFERTIETFSLRLMADPAEANVLVLPASGATFVNHEDVDEALTQVGLNEKVDLDRNSWQLMDALVVIPWRVAAFTS